MNSDQFEGKWKQMKGAVKEKWGKLTNDDLDVINGKQDQLVGKIQERYGLTKEEAAKQFKDWNVDDSSDVDIDSSSQGKLAQTGPGPPAGAAPAFTPQLSRCRLPAAGASDLPPSLHILHRRHRPILMPGVIRRPRHQSAERFAKLGILCQ